MATCHIRYVRHKQEERHNNKFATRKQRKETPTAQIAHLQFAQADTQTPNRKRAILPLQKKMKINIDLIK